MNLFRRKLSLIYPFTTHDSGQLLDGFPKKFFVQGIIGSGRDWWPPLACVIQGVSKIFKKLFLEIRSKGWKPSSGSSSLGEGLSMNVLGYASAEETSS